MEKQETLGTIWEVPDELWERIEPIILEEDPSKARGRKRADPRQMLNGIIFRLRSGCQWNRLPRELEDDSTIHRTFQRWVEEEEPQHLCLDKGYDNPSGCGAAAGHGYREHIRRIGEEKLDASGEKRYPARRWVVKRTLAWLSKCRAVLVR